MFVLKASFFSHFSKNSEKNSDFGEREKQYKSKSKYSTLSGNPVYTIGNEKFRSNGKNVTYNV